MMNPNVVYSILESWEYSGEMTGEMAEAIAENLDAFLEIELAQVDQLADSQPEAALAMMMRLTSFLNTAASKKPSLMRKLQNWVNQIKAKLQKLGQKLVADSISISVGAPIGMSVGLSWDI